MNDYSKENYITSKECAADWLNHANAGILRVYNDYITGSVLDFGCNHGGTTFHLSSNKNVTEITGLDINDNCRPYFEQIFADVKIPNTFLCSNILDIEMNNSYDTIVSFHTLEHIYEDDLDVVIKKLFNMLKYNGFCIISIPYETAYNCTEHVSFFNEVSLSELFKRNGFIVVECIFDNRWSDSNILTGIFKKEML